MTALWSVASIANPKPPAVSSSPTLPRKSPLRALSFSVGAGARDDSGKIVPLDVKEGDRVLFGKWSGTEVKVGGEDC